MFSEVLSESSSLFSILGEESRFVLLLLSTFGEDNDFGSGVVSWSLRSV